MRHNIVSFIIIYLLSFTLQNPITFAQASFQGLGDLMGGDFFSQARGVSANGLVVV